MCVCIKLGHVSGPGQMSTKIQLRTDLPSASGLAGIILARLFGGAFSVCALWTK